MSENIDSSDDSLVPNRAFLIALVDVLQAISDQHEEVRLKTGVYDAFGPFPGAETVAEYILKYRRDDIPALQVGGPLDLFPTVPLPYGVIPPFTWEHQWPSARRAGVYLIYSVALQPLYVGKASMNRNLGQRLYEYFGGGATCALQDPWPEPPRFVITIVVPEKMPFEAPALEEYLIKSLCPICNTHGMTR